MCSQSFKQETHKLKNNNTHTKMSQLILSNQQLETSTQFKKLHMRDNCSHNDVTHWVVMFTFSIVVITNMFFVCFLGSCF